MDQLGWRRSRVWREESIAVSSVVKSMNVRALEPIRALHDHDGRQSAVASIRTPRRRFRYSTERRSRDLQFTREVINDFERARGMAYENRPAR